MVSGLSESSCCRDRNTPARRYSVNRCSLSQRYGSAARTGRHVPSTIVGLAATSVRLAAIAFRDGHRCGGHPGLWLYRYCPDEPGRDFEKTPVSNRKSDRTDVARRPAMTLPSPAAAVIARRTSAAPSCSVYRSAAQVELVGIRPTRIELAGA